MKLQVPLLLLMLLQLRLANAATCQCTFTANTPVRTETNSKSHVVQYLGNATCFHGNITNDWFMVSGQPDMYIQEDQLLPYDNCILLDASEWLAEIPGLRTVNSFDSNVWMPCLADGHTMACFAASFETCVRHSSLDGCPPVTIEEKRFLLDNTNMCDFEADSLCSWQNVQQGDDFDWIRYRSSTPTDDTGPDFDHTLKNDKGSYMFIETSSPRVQNERAWLVSPLIQYPGSHFQCFQFWYHMKGSSVGTLNVYQTQDGLLPGNLIWSLSEHQGPDWLSGQVPLNTTVGYKLVLEATVGIGYEGDIAVDDFNLTKGFCPPLPVKASRTNLARTNETSTSPSYPPVPADLVLQYFCENINNVNCSRYAYDVPCGTDGRFYPNICILTKEKCSNPHLAIHTDYKHCSVVPGWTTVSSFGTTPVTSILGSEPPIFQLFCENKDHIVCNQFDVVCATDGHFYPNRCEQLKATCTNPALMVSSKVSLCSVNSVNGIWGAWSDWSSCHCNATQTRSRLCDSPPPAGTGLPCNGAARQYMTCKLDHNEHCPVNGLWSSWYPWASCSVTCGVGDHYRLRTCTHPRPQHGGSYCEGEAEERESCQQGICVVDGSWGSWYPWSPCSVSCGVGEIVRARTCTNPRPQNGGSYCMGISEERRPCSMLSCAGTSVGPTNPPATTTVPTVPTTTLNPALVAFCAASPRPTCSQELAPVCGSDKRLYINKCEFTRAFCNDNSLSSKDVTFCTGGYSSTGTISATSSSSNSPTSSTAPSTTGSLLTGTSSTMSSPPETSTPTTTTTGPRGTSETTTAIQCTLCKVNPQLCFVLTKVEMCPDSYCINEVTNKEDGSKWVDRRCGTYDECENDWWHSTSDDPDCQDYKPDINSYKDIHCTYCCTTDNCNRDIKPSQDTLYTHPKK
ncbi:uncharacterized protein LOC127860085 isoform X2 [Dreissena polymorpha]|uniref:uncharacterized protein LOC127860085 isoform X2 n=1 Tax=Dreissena polymorpha TaxID=45954 RepID=UPI0022646F80|nr:uncharacterized protein LOC127860085 isoform X2 [Dreissena polymorpha]